MKLIASLVFLLLSTSNSFANKYYDIKSTPKWVDYKEYEEPKHLDNYYSNEGAFHYLDDYQYNFDNKTSYFRVVKLINKLKGVEKHSYHSTSVNPEFSKVIFHKVYIIRNGEKQDITDKVEISLKDKKRNSETMIFSNEKDVVFFIPGLKDGDILDVSYSKEHKDLFSDNSYFAFLTFNYTTHNLRHRLVSSKALHIKYLNTQEEDVVLNKDGEKFIYEINVGKSEPNLLEQEKYLPYPNYNHKLIQFTTGVTWEQLAEGYSRFYKEPFLLNSVIKKKLKEIKKLNKEEQIQKLVSYVQNDITYLAKYDNEYALKPKNPNITAKKSAGDCKAKVYLLKTLLSKIGIKSNPVLVTQDNDKFISHIHPTTRLFDHVILQVEYDDNTYYVDTTSRSYTSYLRSHSNSLSYEDGLLIKENGGGLIKIERENDYSFIKETELDFFTDNNSVLFSITTYFRKEYANHYRKQYKTESLKKITERFFEYFKETYKNATIVKETKLFDDEKENVIRSEELYKVPLKDIKRKNGKYVFNFRELEDFFPTFKDIGKKRIAPIRINEIKGAEYYLVKSTSGDLVEKPQDFNIFKLTTLDLEQNGNLVSKGYIYEVTNSLIKPENLKKVKRAYSNQKLVAKFSQKYINELKKKHRSGINARKKLEKIFFTKEFWV